MFEVRVQRAQGRIQGAEGRGERGREFDSLSCWRRLLRPQWRLLCRRRANPQRSNLSVFCAFSWPPRPSCAPPEDREGCPSSLPVRGESIGAREGWDLGEKCARRGDLLRARRKHGDRDTFVAADDKVAPRISSGAPLCTGTLPCCGDECQAEDQLRASIGRGREGNTGNRRGKDVPPAFPRGPGAAWREAGPHFPRFWGASGYSPWALRAFLWRVSNGDLSLRGIQVLGVF